MVIFLFASLAAPDLMVCAGCWLFLPLDNSMQGLPWQNVCCSCTAEQAKELTSSRVWGDGKYFERNNFDTFFKIVFRPGFFCDAGFYYIDVLQCCNHVGANMLGGVGFSTLTTLRTLAFLSMEDKCIGGDHVFALGVVDIPNPRRGHSFKAGGWLP